MDHVDVQYLVPCLPAPGRGPPRISYGAIFVGGRMALLTATDGAASNCFCGRWPDGVVSLSDVFHELQFSLSNGSCPPNGHRNSRSIAQAGHINYKTNYYRPCNGECN